MEMNVQPKLKLSIPLDDDVVSLFGLMEITPLTVRFDAALSTIFIEEDDDFETEDFESEDCDYSEEPGYESGYNDGYNDGFSANCDEDKIIGFKAGHKCGYDRGYTDCRHKMPFNPEITSSDPAFKEFLEKSKEEPAYRSKSYLD